jgi:hypothetical protein
MLTGNRDDGFLYGAGLAALLFVPLVMCWRPGQPLFFVHDDWTLLAQMAQMPFGEFVNYSKNEHWFPLFKVIFYGLVSWSGERYHLLVLVNCLLTGVNAVLVQRFLRFHLPAGIALALGFVYAVSAAHAPTVWTASYLQFILSLTFFLTALLLTVRYVRQPSALALTGVGLASLLALLCNNFPLLALAALPLYALLLGEAQPRLRAGKLTLALGSVYLFFIAGYLSFQGLEGASFNNPQILSRLPGPAYLAHVFLAGCLSPFCYLAWGHFHFPPWVFALGGVLLGAALTVTARRGTPRERCLAVFALVLNVLPFLLVSLARHQKSISQAFVPRYANFTLVGALLLLGVALAILQRRFPQRLWPRALLLVVASLSLAAQMAGATQWRSSHLAWGREARALYTQAKALPPGHDPGELIRRPWLEAHTPLTWSQFQAIGRFLNREAR